MASPESSVGTVPRNTQEDLCCEEMHRSSIRSVSETPTTPRPRSISLQLDGPSILANRRSSCSTLLDQDSEESGTCYQETFQGPHKWRQNLRHVSTSPSPKPPNSRNPVSYSQQESDTAFEDCEAKDVFQLHRSTTSR